LLRLLRLLLQRLLLQRRELARHALVAQIARDQLNWLVWLRARLLVLSGDHVGHHQDGWHAPQREPALVGCGHGHLVHYRHLLALGHGLLSQSQRARRLRQLTAMSQPGITRLRRRLRADFLAQDGLLLAGTAARLA